MHASEPGCVHPSAHTAPESPLLPPYRSLSDDSRSLCFTSVFPVKAGRERKGVGGTTGAVIWSQVSVEEWGQER